ncbi:DUF3141 domain-containing protein [Nitrobacter sp. TKz-YC02]|uniref:DUF3141 domain-containing protein n=1 Tax=Nitrobacter sp. TKz-YC02 TaxID=3398704 RepID=UPI003CE74237
MRADNEIGVAMKVGHPGYLIGFLPELIPGQTIRRIARRSMLIESVISCYPQAAGKPCVIEATRPTRCGSRCEC